MVTKLQPDPCPLVRVSPHRVYRPELAGSHSRLCVSLWFVVPSPRIAAHGHHRQRGHDAVQGQYPHPHFPQSPLPLALSLPHLKPTSPPGSLPPPPVTRRGTRGWRRGGRRGGRPRWKCTKRRSTAKTVRNARDDLPMCVCVCVCVWILWALSSAPATHHTLRVVRCRQLTSSACPVHRFAPAGIVKEPKLCDPVDVNLLPGRGVVANLQVRRVPLSNFLSRLLSILI